MRQHTSPLYSALIIWLFICFFYTTEHLYAQGIKRDSTYYLLTGSYTEGNNEGPGISVYHYHPDSGTLETVSTLKVPNPSFLASSADGDFVYAVNELHEDKEGAVSAFRFDKEKGVLTHINTKPSGGGDPCYVSLSRDGSLLFVANYSGGNLSVISVREDGSLGEVLQTVQHSGSSVDKSRQEGPHVHGVYPHPGKNLLYVTDLGTDEVITYPYFPGRKEPLATDQKMVYKTSPGSGPRHILIRGNTAYLVKEMGGELEVLDVDEKGHLSHRENYKLYGESYNGKNQAAEVRISPDGKYVYVSNRSRADTISSFSVNEDGTLTPVEIVASGGDTPRNFILSPNGTYLLAAHQDSHTIVVFTRNPETGTLSPTGETYRSGSPVHFIMIEE
ncbi:lactonase family protein [Roseivirga sp. BDSF3-8]|uniref:lactonase family protein n=1 Tax=Roseivirga sp. BDSF3-8 TaxID=3241598 RepID=UPI0035324D69